MALKDMTVTHSAPGKFWLHLASNALKAIRPFFKMGSDQSEAWDIVQMMVDKAHQGDTQ